MPRGHDVLRDIRRAWAVGALRSKGSERIDAIVSPLQLATLTVPGLSNQLGLGLELGSRKRPTNFQHLETFLLDNVRGHRQGTRTAPQNRRFP